MKNTGSQVTKPYSNVLMVIRQIEPTIIRDSSGARIATTAGRTPARSGPWSPAAAACLGRPRSRSSCMSASASSRRPTASSQRGDSGRFLRMYQTTSAPMPPSTNMARHPNIGTTNEATSQRHRQATDDADGHQPQILAPRTRGNELGHRRVADHVFGTEPKAHHEAAQDQDGSCSVRMPPQAMPRRTAAD